MDSPASGRGAYGHHERAGAPYGGAMRLHAPLSGGRGGGSGGARGRHPLSGAVELRGGSEGEWSLMVG